MFPSEAALYKIARRFYDDDQIQAIFEAIQQLVALPEKPRKKIGFEVRLVLLI